MSDFILHHYPLSPYAEQIRMMLHYSDQNFQSLIHSEMPPRRNLKVLVGEYGRIPVAQIGADIFCDSKLIAEEVAGLVSNAELDPFQVSKEIQQFFNYCNEKTFFASVMMGSNVNLRKKALKQMSYFTAGRLLFDRLLMKKSATTENFISPTEAKAIAHEFLNELESRLSTDYLFGDTINVADFAAFKNVWFMYELGECRFLKDYPAVCEWMERIKSVAISKGASHMIDVSAKKAWNDAKSAEPRELKEIAEQHSADINKKVGIGPSDYRQTQTIGILRFEDDDRYIIERENSKVGKVHVHFPKKNYTKSVL